MKVRIKGVYATTKKLASGQRRTYFYHRATGARLPDDSTSPEFAAEVQRLNAVRTTARVPARSLAALIREYRSDTAYRNLAAGTRAEYDRHLKLLEDKLGGFPVADFKRSHVMRLVSSLADRPAKAAGVGRMCSILFSHALELDWIASHPCLGLKLPKTGRGQKPYEEGEIRRFRERHPRGTRARLVFEICLAAAIRISDTPGVSADGLRDGMMCIISEKTDRTVCAAVTRELRDAFAAWESARAETGRPLGRYALGDHDGRPLHKRTISREMEAAYMACGFEEGQRSHALRYTACIRLFENGYTYEEIAETAGHSMAAMARKYCEKKRNARARVSLIDAIDAQTEPAGP